MPTLTGYITATATPTTLEVAVPCNSAAKLCLPRSTKDTVQRLLDQTPLHTALRIDGDDVESFIEGGHLCTSVAVGCRAGAASRVLEGVLV